MPRGDGTGPMGMGPMTGRAAGFCAGNTVPGCGNPVPGWCGAAGFGRGFGGRGRRGGFRLRQGLSGVPWAQAGAGMQGWGGYPPPYAAAPTAGRELDVLKSQAEYCGGVLEDIKQRIGELEAGKQSE